jgi:hypothetical protein
MRVLIGSANLTARGLIRNVEAGLLLHMGLEKIGDQGTIEQISTKIIDPLERMKMSRPENIYQITTKDDLQKLLRCRLVADETSEEYKNRTSESGRQFGPQAPKLVPDWPVPSGLLLLSQAELLQPDVPVDEARAIMGTTQVGSPDMPTLDTLPTANPDKYDPSRFIISETAPENPEPNGVPMQSRKGPRRYRLDAYTAIKIPPDKIRIEGPEYRMDSVYGTQPGLYRGIVIC